MQIKSGSRNSRNSIFRIRNGLTIHRFKCRLEFWLAVSAIFFCLIFNVLPVGNLVSATETEKDRWVSPFQIEVELSRDLRKSTSSGAAILSKDLILTLEDRHPVPNACAYFVRRIEYIPGINSLMIDLGAQEPCHLDVYARRAARLYWPVPAEIESNGNLNLIINGRPEGRVQWEKDFIQVKNN